MLLRSAFLLPCAIMLAGPAAAAPGGAMWTIGQGAWACELPGDALQPPTPQPGANFRIVPDSSYIAASGGRGAYLLLGDRVAMTSGPFAGQRYAKVGGATLIRLGADGQRVPLRCIRVGAQRDAAPDAAGDSPNAP